PVYLDLSAISDPGTDTVSQWFVDWGDGQSETFDIPGPHAHRYADGPAVHTIGVGLADEDGMYLDLASSTVTVEDAAPTIELVGLPSSPEGTPYSLELGTVTDLGVDNVIEWIVHWGDGTTESFGASGAHSHVYL